MPSYSIRCIILWKRRKPNQKKYLYEERVTLWRCAGIDKAIARGEKEAQNYAQESGDECLDLVQAYSLTDEFKEDGAEVFSLLRESDLPPAEYVDSFFNTGDELQ